MKLPTETFFLLALTVAIAVNCGVASAATIIDDFSGGVVGSSHPDPANSGTQAFSHWYDVTNDAFAPTPVVATLDASDAMRIDDGGFTNGVYAIYESVIPADGVYTLSASMHINEDPAQINSFPAYQIGEVVNGVHRGPNPSDLAAVGGPGSAVGDYAGLTMGDDSGLATQVVETGTFSALAGDNLLIVFSTDITSGDFTVGTGAFGSGHILVDNITLNAIPEPTSVLLVGMSAMGFVARRK